MDVHTSQVAPPLQLLLSEGIVQEYVCVNVRLSVYTYAFVSFACGGQKGSFLRPCSPCSFQTGSLIVLKLTKWPGLACQRGPGTRPSQPPQCLDYKCGLHILPFCFLFFCGLFWFVWLHGF